MLYDTELLVRIGSMRQHLNTLSVTEEQAGRYLSALAYRGAMTLVDILLDEITEKGAVKPIDRKNND